MVILFACCECGSTFEEPKIWEETHGFDYGPYEKWSGCPYCGSDYAKAHQCDCCGKYITDTYIKVEHQRYCQDCYQAYELGDED
jgi:hypothetical protein